MEVNNHPTCGGFMVGPSDWTKPSTIIPLIALLVAGAIGYGILQGRVTNLSESLSEEKLDVAESFREVDRHRGNQWRVVEGNREGISENKSEGRVINQKLKSIEEKVSDIKNGQERIMEAIRGIKQ
jgi:hypothetical protein